MAREGLGSGWRCDGKVELPATESSTTIASSSSSSPSFQDHDDSAPPDVPVFCQAAAAARKHRAAELPPVNTVAMDHVMNAIDVQWVTITTFVLAASMPIKGKLLYGTPNRNPGKPIVFQSWFLRSLLRLRRHHRIRLYPG